MRGLILIGAGGHAKVVLDALTQSDTFPNVRVFAEASKTSHLLDHRVETPVADPKSFDRSFWMVHVAIGNNSVREKIATQWIEHGFECANILHPRSFVSSNARLASGIFIGPYGVVNADAQIGTGVIINTGAIVEHDCHVGNYAHLSPGAALGGGCRIGLRSWIGMNGAVREMIEISDDVVLGAGSVATRSIRDPGVFVGSPARRVGSR